MAVAKSLGAICAENRTLERAVVWLGHHYPNARIATSLCYHTAEHVFKRMPDAVRVASVDDGVKLELPLSEHMFRHLYFFGRHEEEVTTVVKHLAAPGQTWLDVGGNIGYYTVLLSRLVGTTGQVHAFEPNPDMADRICRSLRLNGATNVTLCQSAVASKSGDEVILHVPLQPNITDGGSGRSSLIPQSDISGSRPVAVQTVALDDHIARHGLTVDYMKIDIEGYEMAAYEGMRETLRSAPPKVIVSEVSHRPDCLAAPAEVIAYLAEFGYLPYSVRREGLVRLAAGSSLNAGLDSNIAFVQASSTRTIESLVRNSSDERIGEAV